MPTFKIVLTTWLDSTEPSDGLQITPTFSSALPGFNAETLASDLLDAWNPWLGATVRDTQQRAVVYDVQGAKPNYPKYQETRFPDVAKASPSNRDVALCLTGFHDNNRPRFRGRLYIPMCLTGVTPTGSNASPTARDKVAALVPILTGLGGVDVDWGVWSTVDNAFRSYTDWYVDDAWDTQRRRGKRATARTAGTTSE